MILMLKVPLEHDSTDAWTVLLIHRLVTYIF